MPRHIHTEDDWDEDFDSDLDDESGAEEDDDEEPTIPCPHCRRQIHEDSPRCPYCENYLSDEEAPSRKPWWIILGVGVCLYVVYKWIAG